MVRTECQSKHWTVWKCKRQDCWKDNQAGARKKHTNTDHDLGTAGRQRKEDDGSRSERQNRPQASKGELVKRVTTTLIIQDDSYPPHRHSKKVRKTEDLSRHLSHRAHTTTTPKQPSNLQLKIISHKLNLPIPKSEPQVNRAQANRPQNLQPKSIGYKKSPDA